LGVSFTDASTGTVVGEGGTILRTTDGGTTWVHQLSGTKNWLWGVSFTDANTGTAVGGSGIRRTTNGGTTWQSQSSETRNSLLDVSFTDANTGTAVGNFGTILRTTTGGVTWIEEDPQVDGQLPQNFALQQNYPNPFNPNTTIEYALPHTGYVALKVHNVLGEEVAILVSGDHAAGTFRTTWDASGMPSGVYFYRLTTGEYVQTKKMVLMR
jgi:hypothetical protein